MEKIKLLSFQDALSQAGNDKTLLLGNGFSISWRPSTFTYNSLKEKSTGFEKIISDVFEKLNTVDFEEVIQAFENAAIVCESGNIKNCFADHAETIRNVLIETISNNHPDNPSEISVNEFESCLGFLSNFKRIYTINYDMLLYWVLMHDMFRDNGDKKVLKNVTDGFAYNNEDFLNWDGTSFDIYYLHGALHLFENGRIKKLNYSQSNGSLKSQFMNLIKGQKIFPLFVAEGSSEKKRLRIGNSGYLTRCLNSLQKIGAKKTVSSLFSFGVSFSENDDHILQALVDNNCKNFYIGIFGPEASSENQYIINRTM